MDANRIFSLDEDSADLHVNCEILKKHMLAIFKISQKGKKLEEISIFSATFCLAQQKQVNIWLKGILDSSTTHFDQVLPNKILLTS